MMFKFEDAADIGRNLLLSDRSDVMENDISRLFGSDVVEDPGAKPGTRRYVEAVVARIHRFQGKYESQLRAHSLTRGQ